MTEPIFNEIKPYENTEKLLVSMALTMYFCKFKRLFSCIQLSFFLHNYD